MHGSHPLHHIPSCCTVPFTFLVASRIVPFDLCAVSTHMLLNQSAIVCKPKPVLEVLDAASKKLSSVAESVWSIAKAMDYHGLSSEARTVDSVRVCDSKRERKL